MRKSTKIVGVCMVAGIVAAAGSAATGNGFTNSAGAAQFIGGSAAMTVSGATLSSIAYTGTTAANTTISSIQLTFASTTPDGKTVTLTTSGGTVGTYTCEAIGDTTTHISTCSAASGHESSNFTGMTVTVA